MLERLRDFFSTSDFMPHGHCFLWKPSLVGLHVSSDALIGTAYLIISITLWQLVRRIRLPFSPMILAFGVFIGACGLTHYMEIWTLWDPQYWLSGGVKLITAVASVATGAFLVRLRPAIVTVTHSAQVSEDRRGQLEVKNRELEALYGRVKELDDAKTRFFANASHELRTPLALILGSVEKALAVDVAAPVRRDLEVARRNARVLLRHVNELLDVSRIEEGRATLTLARGDLAALVRDVAQQFDGLARERHVELSVAAPDALPGMLDAPKLEHVVANLLGNAFKFVPDGGRVRVGLAAAGGGAALTVDDDGPGISPEMRAHVFERFRQDPGRSSHAGGAGLGLAIAKDFVELHGGSIQVADSPLGGARLEVRLPLDARTDAASSPPAAEAPEREPAAGERGAAWGAGSVAAQLVAELRTRPSAKGGTVALAPDDAPSVLVVEDDPEMLDHVVEALAVEFRVAGASDGAEGLEKAQALQPDAIVTDLLMPRSSGEGLVAELRRRPALAGTPTVVLSARADEEARVHALRGGAADYVLKPFRPEELRARVRNAVSMKRSRDLLSRELRARTGDVEALAAELARRKRELEVSLEAARVAREHAERASKVKTRFLGLVSHELRTPLTSIQLSISSLRSGHAGSLTPTQLATVDRLARAAQRLLGLVNSLLEYTRVESGRLVVRPEPVDVAALVAEVVEDVLPQAQQKLLTLALEPPPPMAPVTTDPRLLRLVLVNLVVNGVKYTTRGSVTVRLGAAGATRWIEVRDTGPGIQAEDQVRAFQPFEQLSPAGTSGGVGLGLALVNAIVAALGGALHVESAAGRGSTFRVELPETLTVERGEAPPGPG
jgi:signal transduction histidine kinase